MIDKMIWSEKYRPKTVDDLIATPAIRDTVRSIIADNSIPNILLVGASGIGKTTIARMLVEQLDADYVIINGSLKGNIDTLRNEIQSFASSVSFTGRKKYVILDEADGLNPQSTQPALRNFIDTFHENCGFILTANYRNKLLPELVGRMEVYDFRITNDEMPALIRDFTKRALSICKEEGVDADLAVVAKLAAMHAPNWRAIINALQGYGRRAGKIDAGILTSQFAVELSPLIPMIRARDFPAARKWIGENVGDATGEIFTSLVDTLSPVMQAHSLGALITIAAKYQYQAAFVADHQLNFAAAIAEIIASCVVA